MSYFRSVTRTLRTMGSLVRQMKPLFWPVAMIPYFMSWSLASEKVFPTVVTNLIFLPDPNPAADPSMEAFKFFLGLIAIGPFMGGATILYNDYWDMTTDLENRRKKYLPLLKGILTRRMVLLASVLLFILSILTALLVSYTFLLFVLLVLLLSLAYSGPPLRLKEKPGLDVLTNAIGSGVVCSLAGWTLVRGLPDFPLLWGFSSFFGVCAIYFPTTLIDYEPDVKYGVKTIAVYLGKKRVYQLGVLSVILANGMIVTMCLTGYILDMGFFLYALPIVAAQIGFYWYLLRKQDFEGGYQAILILTIFLGIGNALLLFYHAGQLPPIP